MKEFRQIRGLVIVWFFFAISMVTAYLIFDYDPNVILATNFVIGIIVADLIIFLLVLNHIKSVSKSYFVLFSAFLLPQILTIISSQYMISRWDDPKRVLVSLVILTTLAIDVFSRFYYQKNKLYTELMKSPGRFWVNTKEMVATIDLLLPSDSEKWFHSLGKIFQSSLALFVISIRVFIRTHGLLNDPLTFGLLYSAAVIIMNEEVFKLLFLGLGLKRIEEEKGVIIIRTSVDTFIN